MKHRAMGRVAGLVAAATLALSFPVVGYAMPFSSWGAPEKVDEISGNSSEVNTGYLDGCPIESPDGLSLYLASNRPRFAGDTRTDIDIWVARRESTHAVWGAPQNLGEPVNSPADDFCPTPIRGRGLFFVSRRLVPGSCGGSDIYFARLNPATGWSEPRHFGCQADAGPNSADDEMSPSYVETEHGAQLYFSSGADIYVSILADGGLGPALAVAELNSASADLRPNVRKDGLEIVFDSTRPGSRGGFDIYAATRDSVNDPWSVPVNLGDVVNTDRNETRASFSWDVQTLYFGRAPGTEGSTDIYLTVREKLAGGGR
jgi:WD40-like Beta Propeller Repeat